MQTVAERILKHAETLPEGALISAKEFLHLASRPAVDQALKRLAHRHELMRLARGLYVLPVKTRFGTRAPAPEKVVAGIAAAQAETVVPHGAAAANALGLTTQVPTKLVYLTSGRSRHLKLGAQVVEMKKAPQWMLLPSHRAAGEAVRALAWIGKHRAPEVLKSLKQKLSPRTIEELVALRPALPAWMSKSISETLAVLGGRRHHLRCTRTPARARGRKSAAAIQQSGREVGGSHKGEASLLDPKRSATHPSGARGGNRRRCQDHDRRR